MNQPILIFFFSFLIAFIFQNNSFAQNGNVGIGTTDPQAKLHVDGNARVDDKLEIKNSNGETIFSFDPENKQFDILDTDGSVFHRIGLVPSENAQLDVTTFNRMDNPIIETFKDVFGVPTILRRRLDGTVESEEKFFDSNGSTQKTFFYSNGNILRLETIFPEDGGVEPGELTSFFSPDGKKTHSFRFFSNDGSSRETFFNENETIKREIHREGNPSNDVTQSIFDSNGILIRKRKREGGVLKFFNKDCEEVTKEEFENGFTKTITDPSTGNKQTTTADGTVIEDTNGNRSTTAKEGVIVENPLGDKSEQKASGLNVENNNGDKSEQKADEVKVENSNGDKSEQKADEVKVEDSTGKNATVMADKVQVADNNRNSNLHSGGIEVNDLAANIQFFNDIFGTSVFDGSNSVSTGFDLINGNFDIFAGLDVSGLLSKGGGSFKIDHPLDPTNKFLYHSFVESPDMMNIYNGNITTNENGEAVVELPTYFEALNMDFRYQLTVIGSFAQAIVGQEVQHNSFKIQTNEPNVKVSWQVTGIRNDTFAQANRIQVEVEKTGKEVGQLLFDPNQAANPYQKNQQHWEKRQAFLNKELDKK